MIVGVLSVDILLPEGNSLKDKRQVVKSILDRIKSRFNISAAEVGDLDLLRKSVLGFACISGDRKVANTVLNNVLSSIESDPRVSVVDCRIEFL